MFMWKFEATANNNVDNTINVENSLQCRESAFHSLEQQMRTTTAEKTSIYSYDITPGTL